MSQKFVFAGAVEDAEAMNIWEIEVQIRTTNKKKQIQLHCQYLSKIGTDKLEFL